MNAPFHRAEAAADLSVTVGLTNHEPRIAEILSRGNVEQALFEVCTHGIRPPSHEARQMKAMILMRQRNFVEAEKIIDSLLEESSSALNLKMKGDVSFLQTRFNHAKNYYGRALGKTPNHPDIVHDYAVATVSLGHVEDSIRDFRKACELAPTRADFFHHLAIMLVLAGHNEEGWKLMEARRKCPGVVGGFPNEEKYWAGENLKGKTIVIRTEQGFGDTIQFMRFVEPILGMKPKKVYAFCQPEMCRWIEANWPEVEAWGHKAPPPTDFDYHINTMSFPNVFPGLYLPRKKKETKGEGIGVVWFGSPTHKADHLRTVPFERFMKLADQHPKNKWHCLGYGFFDKRPDNFHYLIDRAKDWQDTAEKVKDLRLVITVDTAMAHLAAHHGVETWLLLPYVPDFRWGMTGESTPWYESMKLYRQPKLMDWDSVFARVSDDLAKLDA